MKELVVDNDDDEGDVLVAGVVAWEKKRHNKMMVEENDYLAMNKVNYVFEFFPDVRSPFC